MTWSQLPISIGGCFTGSIRLLTWCYKLHSIPPGGREDEVVVPVSSRHWSRVKVYFAWNTCADTIIVPRLQMLPRLLGASTSSKTVPVDGLFLARVDDWRETAVEGDGLTDPRRLPDPPPPPTPPPPPAPPPPPPPPPPQYEWNRLDIRCSSERRDTRSGSYSNEDSEFESDVCVSAWPWSLRRISSSILRLQSKLIQSNVEPTTIISTIILYQWWAY